MITTRWLGRLIFRSVLALLAAGFVAVSGAHAQLTKIFVASYGNDANDGSRGAPKRTFQLAHDAVATGGQIVVLDTAGYGPLAITKSISVTVPPGANGFVTTTGNGSGITINAGSSATVSLRGLIVEGGGAGPTNGYGIYATSVGNLAITDCTVRNFNEGIYVLATVATNVFLRGSTVRGCEYGLDLETANNVAVTVVALASGCQFDQCTVIGVLALPGNVGSVDLTLAESIVSGNSVGVKAGGTGALMRVNNCNITGNTAGAAVASGGQLFSRGNNTLEKNGSGNAFPATYSAK